MSKQEIPESEILGIECKNVTYIKDQTGKPNDLHYVKEVVHLKDGTLIPRMRPIINYPRDYYVTHKGQRNHNEKKGYEELRNLQKYSSTQVELERNIQKVISRIETPNGDKIQWSPNPRLRQLAKLPYLYGSDISGSSCIKNEYRLNYPEIISRNTVAGGDIETNVYEAGKDGEIICMSVTHKENVYLAYLDRWVSDIKDPVKETLDELERIPELVTLKKARNLKIQIEVVKTPAEVAIRCINKLHEWKPDFFAFWNIDFDMSRIIKNLEQHGIDPKDVFSDPSVPEKFKYFYYKKDLAMQTTASGVTKSKGPEDQWHWITTPASFQCIDAMATYRVTRLARGKEPSYALDYILNKELNVDEETTIKDLDALTKFMKSCQKKIDERNGSHPYWYIANPDKDTINEIRIRADEEGAEDEIITEREPNWELVENLEYGVTVFDGYKVKLKLNFGKLKFKETDHLNGIEWHIEMQKNHKIRYGLYNIIDSIRLEQLDERTTDLARSITLYSKNSDFCNFNSNPKRLIDDMHFWYLDHKEPKVIGSSSGQPHELDQFVVSHKSWIITLPCYMAGPNGVKCVKEFPDYKSIIFCHVADLDIVSTYPTVSQILNAESETTVMEFSAIWETPENITREAGVNLTGCRTNALEIAQKIFKAPKLDDLLASYLMHKANSKMTLLESEPPK